MKYKGYEAIVEFDDEDRLFVGRVINTRDVIAFDASSVDELEQSSTLPSMHICKTVRLLEKHQTNLSLAVSIYAFLLSYTAKRLPRLKRRASA
jgi:hypothetical protein